MVRKILCTKLLSRCLVIWYYNPVNDIVKYLFTVLHVDQAVMLEHLYFGFDDIWRGSWFDDIWRGSLFDDIWRGSLFDDIWRGSLFEYFSLNDSLLCDYFLRMIFTNYILVT